MEKEELLNYLIPKFETLRKATDMPVFAELESINYYGKSQPCVIIAQPTKEDVIGCMFIEVKDKKICSFSLTSVLPDPRLARRSGVYPK